MPPPLRRGGTPTGETLPNGRNPPTAARTGRNLTPIKTKDNRLAARTKTSLPQEEKSRRELQARDRGFDLTQATPS